MKRPKQLGALLGCFLSLLAIYTNVISPSSGPDNSGVILGCWLALFLAFGFAGFFVERTPVLSNSYRAGAWMAGIGIGILMATFVVVDNVFLEIVSRQPEKIWGFQHSHYPTMRSYVNGGLWRGILIAWPIIILIGGISGVIGGFIRKLMMGSNSDEMNKRVTALFGNQ